MDVFPKATGVALQDLDLSTLPGVPSIGLSCAGAKFHSPRPLLLHPLSTVDGRTVHLCAVCRDNLRVLSNLVEFYEGNLPWTIRREFGNRIRSLAVVHPEGNTNV